MKRLTTVCEDLRILVSTSTSPGWKLISEELTELAVRMKDSGYSEKLRGEVVRDATLGWERKVQVAEAGQRPTRITESQCVTSDLSQSGLPTLIE